MKGAGVRKSIDQLYERLKSLDIGQPKIFIYDGNNETEYKVGGSPEEFPKSIRSIDFEFEINGTDLSARLSLLPYRKKIETDNFTEEDERKVLSKVEGINWDSLIIHEKTKRVAKAVLPEPIEKIIERVEGYNPLAEDADSEDDVVEPLPAAKLPGRCQAEKKKKKKGISGQALENFIRDVLKEPDAEKSISKFNYALARYSKEYAISKIGDRKLDKHEEIYKLVQKLNKS